MVESDVYETKKSFVNVTCYLRFQKCLVICPRTLFIKVVLIFNV
jgi:hypothetical protein